MYLSVFSVLIILLYQCLIGVVAHNPYKLGVPELTEVKMHSKIITKDYQGFKVMVLPALRDNFMYLLIDKKTNQAAVVDPIEPKVVWEAVHKEKVNLTTVLTTHHHWDHAGGNKELIEISKTNPLTVVGGDDNIEGLTFMIDRSEVDIHLGSLIIKGILTPCHTSGHVCYYLSTGGDDGIVFTGDTLFVAGCGRFFEGTAKEMYEALMQKLFHLPDKTDVYCGHEYATQNLLFALRVEPHNQDIIELMKSIGIKRKTDEPSVPSTIGMEKRVNPFMRVNRVPVQQFTNTIGNPVETMRLLREKKDYS